MPLRTVSVSSRRDTINHLKTAHEKLLHLDQAGTSKYIPKVTYTPEQSTEEVISFFKSELLAKQDIYTEFVDANLAPTSGKRTLWKWPFNPDYETGYEKSEPHPATGHCRYLVPITELINVAVIHGLEIEKPKEKAPAKPTVRKAKLRTIEESSPQLKMEIPEEPIPTPEEVEANEPHMHLDDDAPLSEMTMRDQLAITWLEPVSKKKWLNDLIEQKNKNSEPIHFIPG